MMPNLLMRSASARFMSWCGLLLYSSIGLAAVQIELNIEELANPPMGQSIRIASVTDLRQFAIASVNGDFLEPSLAKPSKDQSYQKAVVGRIFDRTFKTYPDLTLGKGLDVERVAQRIVGNAFKEMGYRIESSTVETTLAKSVEVVVNEFWCFSTVRVVSVGISDISCRISLAITDTLTSSHQTINVSADSRRATSCKYCREGWARVLADTLDAMKSKVAKGVR